MTAGHLQVKKGYYYAVLTYKDANGKRKQPWVPTGLPERGNKKKAEEALMEIRRTFVPPEDEAPYQVMSKNMLFSDYMKEWLRTVRDSVEATTFSSYSFEVNKHIVPYFEKTGVSLEGLEPRHLQSFYNHELRQVSSTTVQKLHARIHSALKYAVKMDIISGNPSDKVDPPRKRKYVADYYKREELEKLFEVSKDDPIGLIIQMTAFYGFRRSEVVGLKWDAIDFERNTITVKHVVTQTKVDGKLKMIREDRAKTRSSLRSLPLAPGFKEKLLEHKRIQEENRKLCGNCYNREFDGYVFVNAIGDLIKPEHLSDRFKKILKKNGLREIRFHDLRHSCASLMLANDIPMKQIQEWLGHSDISTTANIYSHLDYKAKIASADIMEGAMDIPDVIENSFAGPIGK